ncbi:MAG: PAS domain S-box protein [Chloroflexi bacterium]|nr:PAS domain S-box protein [Chloroflexota bacterium]
MATQGLTASGTGRHFPLGNDPDEMIALFDNEARFLYVSPSSILLLGYSPEELIGKNVFFLVPPEEQKTLRTCYEDALTGWEEQFVAHHYRHRSGEWRVFESHCSWIHGRESVPQRLITVSRDITSRVDEMGAAPDRAALRQSAPGQERSPDSNIETNALFETASDIIHECGNVLTPILGLSELLLTLPGELENREQLLHHLRLIHTAAKDAVEVTGRWRLMRRPGQEQGARSPVDVNSVVEQVVALTRSRWLRKGVSMDAATELAPGSVVVASESGIRRILMNLVLNALDAVGEKGTIRIRTLAGDGCVVLEVRDNGSGMSEEVRQRCLEPYFSTKPNGMGVGLAIVNKLVNGLGGSIEIESEPGAGATFRIILPKSSPAGHR